MFGDADPFSDFFHTFFGGAAGGDGARAAHAAAAAPRGARRGATSSRRSSSRSKTPFTARRAACRSSTTARRGPWTSGFRPASATDRASASPARANTAAAARKSGDLYLRVRLVAAPALRAQGARSLHARRRCRLRPPSSAAKRKCRRSAASPLRLKVPPTTQNGQVFRLKGHGMPAVGKSARTRRSVRHGRRRSCPRSSRRSSASTSRRCRNSRRHETLDPEAGPNHEPQQVHRESAEAVSPRSSSRSGMSHPQIEPEHLLVALVEQRDGIVPEVLRKMSADPKAVADDARELLSKMPSAYGGSQAGMSPRLKLVTDRAQAEADRLKDEFVSTEHLFVAIASEGGRSPAARLLTARELTRDTILRGAHQRARLTARHESEPRGHVSGARTLRPRPDRAGAQGQARSGDRPRRRNPPRDPGALAPHEEQPGADRRTRRRQDRHRRRARRPHHSRRRARRGSRTRRSSRSTWAR